MNAAVPEEAFREVLVRGGWYRLGGVVDASGRRVADDIVRWAEAELAARGDDMQALADDLAGRGLRATRFNGKTRYRVAATGDGPANFMQLDIEELQEVACAPLFAGDALPAGVEDLVDPGGPCAGQTPLGPPSFVRRRLTDIAGFLARMREQKPEPQPVHRFVEDWGRSSAGAATRFSDHWVLALREHLDRHRQMRLDAAPVAAGKPPKFEGAFGARGLALRDALTRFDRQAGYPMAWFFHMLTTKTVPHALAGIVVEDMQTGFAYLPDRDVQVVKDWLHRPYGF